MDFRQQALQPCPDGMGSQRRVDGIGGAPDSGREAFPHVPVIIQTEEKQAGAPDWSRRGFKDGRRRNNRVVVGWTLGKYLNLILRLFAI